MASPQYDAPASPDQEENSFDAPALDDDSMSNEPSSVSAVDKSFDRDDDEAESSSAGEQSRPASAEPSNNQSRPDSAEPSNNQSIESIQSPNASSSSSNSDPAEISNEIDEPTSKLSADQSNDEEEDDDNDKKTHSSPKDDDSDDDDDEDSIHHKRKQASLDDDGDNSEVERSDNEQEQQQSKDDHDESSDDDEDNEKSPKSDDEQTIKRKRRVLSDQSDDESNSDNDADPEKAKAEKLKAAEQIFGDSESEDEEFEGFKKASDDEKEKAAGDDAESSDEELFRAKKKRIIQDSDESDSEQAETRAERDAADDESDIDEDDRISSQRASHENEEEGESGTAADAGAAVLPDLSSSSEDEDEPRRATSEDFVYDFDLMMQKKKEQSGRNRKRKNFDLINDADDIINELINQMRHAAEEDYELNKAQKAATRKMKLLPIVASQLRKIDLREALLDSGILGSITDWLTPLPDHSLPNLQIRETLLKILLEFNVVDVDRLKNSGIGKAVMYLFKHPKETKENKKRAYALISSWSRHIFNCETDYHSISKEDREQRDLDHMSKVGVKRMRIDEGDQPSSRPARAAAAAEETPAGNLKPGDKGWVPRARVPQPSTRDYVVRPKSSVDVEMSSGSSKKSVTRYEKHLRTLSEMKRAQKSQRAVKISIEGRKL